MPTMRAARIVHQPDVAGRSIVLDLDLCAPVETEAEARAAVAEAFPGADTTTVTRLPLGDWLVPVPDDVVVALDAGVQFYSDSESYSLTIDADD